MLSKLQQNDWDPLSPESWARSLGLVHVPMFGGERAGISTNNHSILLDGLKGSFAISRDEELISDYKPLEWSWSSNMRHIVFLTKSNVFVKRWDSPDHVLTKRCPTSPAGALELFSEMEASRNSRLPDVISRMLKAFRAIRATLLPYTTNTVDYIRVFNALLLGAEQARLGKIDFSEWERSRTISQAIGVLGDSLADELASSILDVSIGHLLDFFIAPDPNTNYILEPDLLIRHAAGQLYQEAHFEIEREAIRQLSFPGMAGDDQSKGTVKRDARFTPPSLARTIVEQAFRAFSAPTNLPDSISVLDPACGSGVFLQETVRELLHLRYKGKVILNAFDISAVSCVITKFCLERVAHEAREYGIDVKIHIEQQDALHTDWSKHDFIFMNPPFLNLQRMSLDERAVVKSILDNLFSGHVDLAMAFLWKAKQSLRAGGLLGTILPNPMLSSNSAAKLREAIANEMSLTLVGSFRGYNYFLGAMVEPAFILLKNEVSNALEQTVRIITAEEGKEDRALRLLRRGYEELTAEQGVEILHENFINVDKINWLPKTRSQVNLLSKLTELNLPQTKELFTIHQGARTGNNEVFVLTKDVRQNLPTEEHPYFKPLAGSKSIEGGRIVPSQYVFFPYDKNGLLLQSEQSLMDVIPQYYTHYLLPHEEKLKARSGIGDMQWWRLTRERSWQWTQSPKIVTKYFGDVGSFAFDVNGNYVVGQGYAWSWKIAENDEYEIRDEFVLTNLYWAYTAILNSEVFRQLLKLHCPQVNGGQFDLSNRYVEVIRLPDLSDNNRVSGDLVEALVEMGHMIGRGELVGSQSLSDTVAKVYGIPLSEWSLE